MTDRMDLDPWGKRKHPDVYDPSPAASPLHPAKRSKVAHPPHRPANVPPNPSVESDSSSSGNDPGSTSSGVLLPTHPDEQPRSPTIEDANNHHAVNDDPEGDEEPPLPEPVVRFADLTVDADARIRAKDAARERERVRLADTRRKRSDATRSWIDGTDDDDNEDREGRAEAGAGAESREEGEGVTSRVRGRASAERPVKKRRKGGVSPDAEVAWSEDKPQEMPQDKAEETPGEKPGQMPQEKQQKPVSPQETPPPEKSSDNGVGGAQTDGQPRSPQKRPLKRTSEEADSLDGEDLAATAQVDASRKRKRLRRRLARTDEL